MSLIAPADFVDKFELTLDDFNTAKIQSYIDRYETITLVELFGKELYDLWVTGIGASDPIYEFLRDPFIEQLECGKILNSKGVNDMLLGVVYFYYSRDNKTQQSANGKVEKKGENSENVSLYRANLQSRWNEAIYTYQDIQAYILDNDDIYSEFLGVRKVILPLI